MFLKKNWVEVRLGLLIFVQREPRDENTHASPFQGESVEVGRVWLELPSPIHSYKPNTSSIRKPSASRIVTPCNSRPMTYMYVYIYIYIYIYVYIY